MTWEFFAKHNQKYITDCFVVSPAHTFEKTLIVPGLEFAALTVFVFLQS